MPADKAKVFISYSRHDEGFAQELRAGLQIAFEVLIDTQEIVSGEKWAARINSLVASCDSVVFVISPDAVKSPECRAEVQQAKSAGKRIFPVMHRTVSPSEIPPELGELQITFFDKAHSFGHALPILISALNTDIDWHREHTRLSGLASRWETRNRPEELLLRGSELADALNWLEKAPQGMEATVALVKAYLDTARMHGESRKTIDENYQRNLELAKEKVAQEVISPYGLFLMGWAVAGFFSPFMIGFLSEPTERLLQFTFSLDPKTKREIFRFPAISRG